MTNCIRRWSPRTGAYATACAGHVLPALRSCLMLLAAIGFATSFWGEASAQVRLPDFGDASEETLTPAEERALGEAFMREVRSQLTLVDDPLVVQYIQSLGYRLVASSNRHDLAFTFFVVEDDSLNAFAAPGGFIGVNSGTIVSTRSEGEVASVLAHEIAHVTQRHIARAFEHASRSNVPLLAGILAAIVVGTQNVEAGQAAVAAIIGGTAQTQINFTRQNELEADRVGIRMLSDAGFDPHDMAGFFEKLQSASRYSPRLPELLSTHPVTTNRIAEARDSARRLPYRQHQSSAPYHLVRTKLRVRTASDPQRVLDELLDERATGQAGSPSANAYGEALALTRLGRVDDAHAVLVRLVETHPDNLAFRAELAGSEARRGRMGRALDIYSEALALYPGDRLLVGNYATALNRVGRPHDTLKLIDEYERLYSMDPGLYLIRAGAYEQLGRSIDSRVDLAEHYYATGRLDQAIQQLRLASQGQDKGQDIYRMTRIEARLEEFESQRKARR